MVRRWVGAAAGILASTIIDAGCDESLPPRTEPAALTGAVRLNSSTVEIIGNSSRGGDLYVSVTNVYTEVLQDTAEIGGTLEISLPGHSDLQCTVRLERSSMINPSLLQEEVLTLGPDTAALFLQPWSFYTPEGKPFWFYLNRWPSVDKRGIPFEQSEPATLLITGQMQCFKNHPPALIPATRVQVSFNIY